MYGGRRGCGLGPVDFDVRLRNVFKKILLLENLCFERKMKSETKLNSENLRELATIEKNAV